MLENYKEIPIFGDGNCAFNSVSAQMVAMYRQQEMNPEVFPGAAYENMLHLMNLIELHYPSLQLGLEATQDVALKFDLDYRMNNFMEKMKVVYPGADLIAAITILTRCQRLHFEEIVRKPGESEIGRNYYMELEKRMLYALEFYNFKDSIIGPPFDEVDEIKSKAKEILNMQVDIKEKKEKFENWFRAEGYAFYIAGNSGVVRPGIELTDCELAVVGNLYGLNIHYTRGNDLSRGVDSVPNLDLKQNKKTPAYLKKTSSHWSLFVSPKVFSIFADYIAQFNKYLSFKSGSLNELGEEVASVAAACDNFSTEAEQQERVDVSYLAKFLQETIYMETDMTLDKIKNLVQYTAELYPNMGQSELYNHLTAYSDAYKEQIREQGRIMQIYSDAKMAERLASQPGYERAERIPAANPDPQRLKPET